MGFLYGSHRAREPKLSRHVAMGVGAGPILLCGCAALTLAGIAYLAAASAWCTHVAVRAPSPLNGARRALRAGAGRATGRASRPAWGGNGRGMRREQQMSM